MHSFIKKLTLYESKDSICKLNPELAKVIDKLPLEDEHSLFMARYPYGAQILYDGILYFPNSSGNFVPLHDKSIDKLVKFAFRDVRFFPMYLCSHNHIQVSFDYPKSNMPVSILSPGKLTGLNDLDDTFSSMIPHAWNWHSGVKTSALFCGENQAEIGRKICQELKFSYDELTRLNYIDFDCIVSKLVRNKLFKANEWYSEILLFPSSWYQNQNNPAWQPFYDALKQIIWDRSKLWRFRWIWDGLLARCVDGDANQLTVAFLKHLISVACGSLTSFTEASEAELPYKAFEEFFKDLFGDSYEFKILCAKGFNCKNSGTRSYFPLLPDMLLDYLQIDMLQYDLVAEKTNLKSLLINFFKHLSEIDLLQGTPLSNIKNHVEFIFDNRQDNFFNNNYVILKAK
ncbi:MAG: hypothetical protein Tsb005_14170 [Gammaproteobacteria bacterium]